MNPAIEMLKLREEADSLANTLFAWDAGDRESEHIIRARLHFLMKNSSKGPFIRKLAGLLVETLRDMANDLERLLPDPTEQCQGEERH